MTLTIKPEYIYLAVVLILMLIQVLQLRKTYKLQRQIEDLWTQIGILAMSAGNLLQTLEKKIDGKQDK